MSENKKIAIVGCSDSKDLAPWKDESWEIWGVNNLFISMKQEIDIKRMRWFEIHNITFDGKNFYRRGDLIFRGQSVNDYIKGLISLGCPVYMQKKWDQIPNSVEYPIKEILQSMGGYFTNTISYEIALAIYEGATEIGIWGVDMAVGTEYAHQRPSCEYFLGVAKGLGINIFVPAEADLLKTRFLYGFQEQEKTAWEKKVNKMMASMHQRMIDAENQERQSFMKKQQYIGALEAAKELNKIWG